MPSELPRLFLARHGDTAWTDSRQRTGRTDIPLNAVGEDRARQFGERLRRFSFASVFTSPLQALREPVNSLVLERSRRSIPTWSSGITGATRGWCFGKFRENGPPGSFFGDGCPEGESPEDVAARADRIIARVMGIEGDGLAFSSGHIIRMIAARWLGLPPRAGRFFYCRPASVGVLAFEHKSRDEPIISIWNQVAHPRE